MEEDEPTTQFLLGIARDAIEICIVNEGGDPAVYDYELDPKGYAACFISAIHHWCHIHGLEWATEISWAEEFFKDDMWHTGGKSMLPPRSPLENGNCVLCGKTDHCETVPLHQASTHPKFSPTHAGR